MKIVTEMDENLKDLWKKVEYWESQTYNIWRNGARVDRKLKEARHKFWTEFTTNYPELKNCGSTVRNDWIVVSKPYKQ